MRQKQQEEITHSRLASPLKAEGTRVAPSLDSQLSARILSSFSHRIALLASPRSMM